MASDMRFGGGGGSGSTNPSEIPATAAQTLVAGLQEAATKSAERMARGLELVRKYRHNLEGRYSDLSRANRQLYREARQFARENGGLKKAGELLRGQAGNLRDAARGAVLFDALLVAGDVATGDLSLPAASVDATVIVGSSAIGGPWGIAAGTTWAVMDSVGLADPIRGAVESSWEGYVNFNFQNGSGGCPPLCQPVGMF